MASQSRYRVQACYKEVATLMKYLCSLGQQFLWPLQGGDCCSLADRARIASTLRQYFFDSIDELLRPSGKANAPAGHGIGL